MGKNKNLKRIQNWDKHLIFFYTIQKCTQHNIILNQGVTEKSLMKNVHMCYIY